MKLSQEIILKSFSLWCTGALFGLGFIVLIMAGGSSSTMNTDQIGTLRYLSFGLMIISLAFAAYAFSTIHKTIDRVKSGQTSVE